MKSKIVLFATSMVALVFALMPGIGQAANQQKTASCCAEQAACCTVGAACCDAGVKQKQAQKEKTNASSCCAPGAPCCTAAAPCCE